MLQVPVAVTRAQTESDPSETNDEERRRRFGQRDHVRIYGRDFPAILEEAGFRVERRSVTRKFGREYALRWGILPDEDLFVAFKAESPAQPTTGPSA